mmetsp:Transcript_125195/g.220442  ORF Transcript_125195/g.220442 Transcript_125195/m.220442 type:complete len:252 (+) Transcript_125195:139-894(+)
MKNPQGKQDCQPPQAKMETALPPDICIFLNLAQHVFHHCHLWFGITRGIVFTFCDLEGLDDTIVHVKRMALAPWLPQHRSWPRVRHGDAKRFCERPLCVCHECEHGALDTLVLGPCLHHSTIVYAEHNYLINALGFQVFLSLQVARDLPCGSGGCESTWQANQDHFLALHTLCDVDFFWRKAEIDLHFWELATNLCHHWCAEPNAALCAQHCWTRSSQGGVCPSWPHGRLHSPSIAYAGQTGQHKCKLVHG